MAIDSYIVYVGVYPDKEGAEADYAGIKELFSEANMVEAYDAAIVEKRDDGKVKLGRSTRRPRGPAGCSAVASVWPPALLWHCSRSQPSAGGSSRRPLPVEPCLARSLGTQRRG